MIIGLIAFFVFDIPTKIKEWRYSIYLTPKIITIEPSKWNTTKSILAVNNNPYPIYSVQLKISEDLNGGYITNIKSEVSKENYPHNFGDAEIDLNAFVISGLSKKENWQRIILHKIDPNSSIDIKLLIPQGENSSKLKLKITNFNKEAASVLTQDRSIAVPFEIID